MAKSTHRNIWSFVLILTLAALIGASVGCQSQSEAPATVETQTQPPAAEPTQPEAPTQTTAPTQAEEPTQAPVEEPTQVTISRASEFLTIDPAFITSGSDYSIAYLIYNGLIKYKPGTREIVGDLAEKWEVSPDGLLYSFWLRKGVKWQKGYGDFTAQDVKYSFERIMNPDTESRFFSEFATVDSIEVEDDYTVHIHMKEPSPEFIGAVLTYRPGLIVNQKAIEELGDQYQNDPVGTGPYYWESSLPGVEIVLKRNPDYFGPEPVVDTVVSKLIQEEAAKEIAMESGDLDMAYFEEPEIQRRVIDNPDLVTIQTPGPRTLFIVININREPFTDVRVRQALSYATDRQKLIDTVMEGMGVPAYTMLNPQMFAYNNEPVYAYDIEKAKELLAEAGYPDGFDQTFDYVLEGGLESDIAAVLQQDWKALGINIEIVSLERGQYQERRQAAEFDFLALSSAREQPSQYLGPYLSSDGMPYPNVIGYSGADDLIFEAMKTPDDTKREELYVAAQRKIQEDAPFIFLAHPVFVLAHRPNIQGAEIGLLLYNVQDLTFTK